MIDDDPAERYFLPWIVTPARQYALYLPHNHSFHQHWAFLESLSEKKDFLKWK
jgi:hypothetical protein